MTDKEHSADTVNLSPGGTSFQGHWPQSGSDRVQVDLGAATHQGLVRTNNEDHHLIVRFGRFMESVLTNLPAEQTPPRVDEVGYGMVVADGIGGMAGGEVASMTAITTLIGLALSTPDWILSPELRDVQLVLQRTSDRFRRIQAALREQGHDDPMLATMGTTLTLGISLGHSLILGHIGDSRAYFFRGGALHQLTCDHTLVQALVDIGQLTPEDAARHPRRHVLSRCISAAGHSPEGDFRRELIADGDQLLLCTDGLTDMLDDAAITAILAGASSADDACKGLVQAALGAGGLDNVTVVLARYRFPQ